MKKNSPDLIIMVIPLLLMGLLFVFCMGVYQSLTNHKNYHECMARHYTEQNINKGSIEIHCMISSKNPQVKNK